MCWTWPTARMSMVNRCARVLLTPERDHFNARNSLAAGAPLREQLHRALRISSHTVCALSRVNICTSRRSSEATFCRGLKLLRASVLALRGTTRCGFEPFSSPWCIRLLGGCVRGKVATAASYRLLEQPGDCGCDSGSGGWVSSVQLAVVASVSDMRRQQRVVAATRDENSRLRRPLRPSACVPPPRRRARARGAVPKSCRCARESHQAAASVPHEVDHARAVG